MFHLKGADRVDDYPECPEPSPRSLSSQTAWLISAAAMGSRWGPRGAFVILSFFFPSSFAVAGLD